MKRKPHCRMALNDLERIFSVAPLAAGIGGTLGIWLASPVPEQTVANVKKDIQEVKDARHDRT